MFLTRGLPETRRKNSNFKLTRPMWMLPFTRDLVQLLPCPSLQSPPLPVSVKQIAKMHEIAAATENLKSERDSLLLLDTDNNGTGEDVIETVAMENRNHTADLPHQQVSCTELCKNIPAKFRELPS